MSLSDQNRNYLKRILSAQLTGDVALPYRLGLQKECYEALLSELNDPDIQGLDDEWRVDAGSAKHLKSELNSILIGAREDEKQEIEYLLRSLSPNGIAGVQFFTEIISIACLMNGHLWKSLGLESRDELRCLLESNFPELVAKNIHGMRWKRFIYKTLCDSHGDYVCKAPNCNECSSFSECFVV